jgi:hypothetical protein
LPPSGVAVDNRLPHWPVRDQGDRGTCVAFAVTACREYEAKQGSLDLSEQYLYWATKTSVGDPWPNQDGTLLQFGGNALAQIGICRRDFWPYDQRRQLGDLTHANNANPSAAAHSDAAQWRVAMVHSSPAGLSSSPSAYLRQVLDATRKPLAISLPVFVDALGGRVTNWTWSGAIDRGWVLDPAPTFLFRDGHAVCVTGWMDDQNAPGGGWFIIRNSWGTRWARNPQHPVPEPGYGRVSARYVDTYLWELSHL